MKHIFCLLPETFFRERQGRCFNVESLMLSTAPNDDGSAY